MLGFLQLCKLNLFFSILDPISCFPQTIFISIWYLGAKSLYILATSHLYKKIEATTLREEEQTPSPFWCLLLQPTVLSAPPTFQSSQWVCGCGGVGGASAAEAAAASQRRSNERTGSWALFGGREWAPSPPSEMWTDFRTLLLFHSLILRLHLVTGNRERACFRMEGKSNTAVLNVCMRACLCVGVCERYVRDGLLWWAKSVHGL